MVLPCQPDRLRALVINGWWEAPFGSHRIRDHLGILPGEAARVTQEGTAEFVEFFHRTTGTLGRISNCRWAWARRRAASTPSDEVPRAKMNPR